MRRGCTELRLRQGLGAPSVPLGGVSGAEGVQLCALGAGYAGCACPCSSIACPSPGYFLPKVHDPAPSARVRCS